MKLTTECGWAGKLLWIDLSSRKITKVPTSDFEPEKYLGGVGLNSKIFWEMGCPKVDALHPDSPLIFSGGPLTGVAGPFTRATVCAIQPQSYPDELFAYSGFGGKFPSELKYAGYDGIVIVGKSDKPVYLSIHDSDVELKDAGELWGLDAFQTQNVLLADDPGASVLTIGPAGENLSRISIIITETSGAAGQGGYGAVMGSKNLKAILTRGTGTVKVGRPDDFMDLFRRTKDAGDWEAGENIAWGRYPNCSRYIKDELKEKYFKRLTGCYACPYQCHGYFEVPGIGNGTQMCADIWYGYHNKNATKPTWRANLLAQKLGINNFELVGLQQFGATAIRMGFATKEDFGLSSFPLLDLPPGPEYGDDEAHHKFVEETLAGIADGTSPVAQGLARTVARLGQDARDLYDAIYPAWGSRNHHVRGVGEALHWATDTRGPMSSCQDYVRQPSHGFGRSKELGDYFGVPGGYLEGEAEGKHRNVYEGTERETVWVQHNQSLKNSLPICELASPPGQFFHPPEMDIRIFEARALSSVTGIEYDVDRLWEAGERIYNIRRAIMVLRENRHRDDDTLNPIWYKPTDKVDISKLPATKGQTLSKPLDRERWEALKDRYYELRGWDVATGVPSMAKLDALGMKTVADRLQTAGKMG